VLRLLQSDSENSVGPSRRSRKVGIFGRSGAHCRKGALPVRVEAKAGKEKQVAEFPQNTLDTKTQDKVAAAG
jgi:hypothetical protein